MVAGQVLNNDWSSATCPLAFATGQQILANSCNTLMEDQSDMQSNEQ